MSRLRFIRGSLISYAIFPVPWSKIDAFQTGVSGGWVFGGHFFFFGGGDGRIGKPRKIRGLEHQKMEVDGR